MLKSMFSFDSDCRKIGGCVCGVVFLPKLAPDSAGFEDANPTKSGSGWIIKIKIRYTSISGGVV